VIIDKPRAMPLVHRIKTAILELGAIRYVPIRGEEGFFIIKHPGTYLDFGQNLGESYPRIRPPWLDKAPLVCNVPDAPINFCSILHRYEKGKYGELLNRDSSDVTITKQALTKAGFNADMIFDVLTEENVWGENCTKVISPTEIRIILDPIGSSSEKKVFTDRFSNGKKIFDFLHKLPRGAVDEYLYKYESQIQKSPSEIQLESVFTAKLKLVDESYYGYGRPEGASKSKEKYTDVDKLVSKEGTAFLKHWTPIYDLLRYVGLLDDGRGKGREPDETTIAITEFIKKELKLAKGKKLAPSKLKIEYDKKLRKDFTPIDEEYELSGDKGKVAEEKIERYQRDVETVRRILKNLMKK